MRNKIMLFGALVMFQSLNAQVEIYNEDFQSGLPATYTVVDNDGLTPDASVSEFVDGWITIVDPDSTSDTIMASTSFFDPVGQADRWLITEGIPLGTYGNVAYWETRSFDPSYPDSYFILVSGTDTQLSSFTDTLDIVYQENETWTQHSGNLSDLGFNNQTVHLAFVNRTYDGFKLFINNIRVEMEDPVGIEELAKVELSVYPNPSSNVINIAEIQDVKSVEVYSITGELLIATQETSIAIDHLAPGKYFVTAEGNQTVGRATFVKY